MGRSLGRALEPVLLLAAIAAFTLLGVLAGVGTGLAPGLHVNNVALLLIASRPAFEGLVLLLFPAADPGETTTILSTFVVGTVIGHSFLDFVPSVYLGAPEEKTALAILPGHRMLLAGEGHVAVSLAARGAIAGVVASIVLLLPLRLFLGTPVEAYERAKSAIAIILLGIVALLIFSEGVGNARSPSRWRRRMVATGVFLSSGGLGWILLDTAWLSSWNWFPLGEGSSDLGSRILFPLFTGLFGFPTLILSALHRSPVPAQDLSRPAGLRSGGFARGILSGSVAGALVSWLPGLSSGAAAALAQFLSKGRGDESSSESLREFMVALGAVSTATSIFTVAVLFIIDRARSGAAVAILHLNEGAVSGWEPASQPPWLLLVLLLSAGLAAIVAYPLTLAFSRLASRRIHRVRYDVLARAVLVVLAALILILAGAAGLMVAVVAGVLGLVPPLSGVKRVHLMGSLIVPVVVLYLGLG